MRNDIHDLKNHCRSVFFLTCLCRGAILSATTLNEFESTDIGCNVEAACQENDHTSLLQVQLSLHQLDEVKPAISTKGSHRNSGEVHSEDGNLRKPSLSQTSSERSQKLNDGLGYIRKLLGGTPLDRHVLSLLQSFTGDHVGSSKRRFEDLQLIIPAALFVSAVIAGGVLMLQIRSSRALDVSHGSSLKFPDSKSFPTIGQSSYSGKQLSPNEDEKSSPACKPAGQGTSPESAAAMLLSLPLEAGALQSASVQCALPLCPDLIVPDHTQLACKLPADLRQKTQACSFEVRHLANRNSTPMCRVLISELTGAPKPWIFLKSSNGVDTLAVLSKAQLSSIPGGHHHGFGPILNIYGRSGVLYGTVQKSTSAGYLVLQGKMPVLVLIGDFEHHNIKVTTSNGQVVAIAAPSSPEEYVVRVHSRADAGLIVLALLAADKLEGHASDLSGDSRVAEAQTERDRPVKHDDWLCQSQGPCGLKVLDNALISAWSQVTMNMMTKDPENKLQIFQERWAQTVDYLAEKHRRHLLQYFRDHYGVHPEGGPSIGR